jgi:glycosyltransferase involved in cell wall biosynthesis
MKKLPLSVCLISGAEAHRIGRALESVADWAAEIIVVLNEEVTDGSEVIAQRHGASVFREPWKGHIAQKNSAAARANQPWVLGLDADEVVSAPLRTEIAALFEPAGRAETFAAYSFPRRSFYCGRWIRHGDWYPDRQTRLWQRGRAKWTGMDPHDKLVVEGPTGRLRADLLHFSNESIARQIAKIAPYQTGFVAQRVAAGRSAGLFELAVRPSWRFVRAYFLRLGFLDGWQGFYIARLTAFSTLTRYALVREAEAGQGGSP